jgi:hypothetical protein
VIAPIFTFDSREKWFPVGVEESLAAMTVPMPGLDVAALNFPANMRQPSLPPVGYHRAIAGGHLWWHQFWLWYLYNPKRYAGTGNHEGDWEMVQIGCVDRAGTRPVLVTGSQHHTGGKREFWRTVQRNGRPAIYVARDSHANYFGPFADLEDQCDGKGLLLAEVEWRPFGRWAAWPGRWGNSTGEGKSPESPGCQGTRWNRPEIFHGQAR